MRRKWVQLAQTFSTHRMRCASFSKVVVSASADVIVKTAGWSDQFNFRDKLFVL